MMDLAKYLVTLKQIGQMVDIRSARLLTGLQHTQSMHLMITSDACVIVGEMEIKIARKLRHQTKKKV